MPKFLDAPSWYDSDGNKRTIVTTMRIGVSNTGGGCYCNVPVISEGSVNLDGIPEQPLYTLPFLSGTQSVGGIPYWSGTQNGYQVFGQGTSGQVLTSNGNAAPSWGKLYSHYIVIGSSSSSDSVMKSGEAIFIINSFSSEEYTEEEVISFLETVTPQFTGGGSGSLEGIPCMFTDGTKTKSDEYLLPVGFVRVEDGQIYVTGRVVMFSRVNPEEITLGSRSGALNATQSYFKVFRDIIISAP